MSRLQALALLARLTPKAASCSSCCTPFSQVSWRTPSAMDIVGVGVEASSSGQAFHAPVQLQAWHTEVRLNAPACSSNPFSSIVRSYAKAAAKAAPAAGSKDASPKTQRRSSTKLFCCRNDRFRSAYEQIWPTMKLSDEEVQLFRRNSRMFVVDMGKSITLKNKFKMNLAEKVHHSAARSLLYEQDIHLDGVGEHPRYLKIRRLRGIHASKLQNMRKIRLLMGFARRKTLQKVYELALLQPGSDRTWKLISAMEAKLGMSAMRMGLAHDVLAANGMVHKHLIWRNGLPSDMPYQGFLAPGDVISPRPGAVQWFQQQYYPGQMGTQLLEEVRQDWQL